MSSLRKLAVAAAVLASVHSAEAMEYSYRTYKGHLVIDAVGSIEEKDATRFVSFLAALPPNLRGLVGKKGNAVVFDSPGGSVIEAVGISGVIDGWHFATGVAAGGQCSSACVLAWAAGAQKSAAADSYIGVHNAALDGIAGHGASKRLKALDVSGKMAQWLQKYGAPDNVINKLLDTPSDDLYRLTPDDLVAWNVKIVGDAPTDSTAQTTVPANQTNAQTLATHCAELTRNYEAAEEHALDALEHEEYGQINKSWVASLRIIRIGRQILADCPLSNRAAFQRHIEDGERMNKEMFDRNKELLDRLDRSQKKLDELMR